MMTEIDAAEAERLMEIYAAVKDLVDKWDRGGEDSAHMAWRKLNSMLKSNPGQ